LDCVEEADAIIWGCWGADVPPPGLLKPPHQVWMYFCMESAMNQNFGSRINNPTHQAEFDLFSTYQLNSSFPRLYVPPNQSLLRLPPRKKHAKVAWVASHCNKFNGNIVRDAFVYELMKHIQVDSYGRCLHNKNASFSKAEHGSALIPLYAQYYFTLALHDSNDDDYVDEKLYLPLIAGSVPIFSGASNVQKFAPSPHSLIDVADFSSAAALATYLNHLIANEAQYSKYLLWKAQPLPLQMMSTIQQSLYTGSRYGEASHHGFPTPVDLCAFGTKIVKTVEARQHP